jgi:uncharacterized protein (TIRG00374 family)
MARVNFASKKVQNLKAKMRSVKFKIAQMLVGLAISAGLLIWIVSQSDWKIVEHEILTMNYWALLPAGVVILFHLLIRAYRWRFLIPSGEGLSLIKLFNASMIGNFASYILPLRAGEFVRPYVLSRQSRVGFSTAFASVVIERFFDLAFVLLTFSVVVYLVDGIPAWAHNGALILFLAASAIFAFIVTASLSPTLSRRSVLFLTRLFPPLFKARIRAIFFNFLRAAGVLRKLSNLAAVTALTALVWGSCYLLFYVFLLLTELNPTILMGTSIAVIIALAVAAPSAPGFVGVYQTACVAAFALFGADYNVAVAYSLVTHFFHFAIFIFYGLVLLANHNISFSDLRTATEKEPRS